MQVKLFAEFGNYTVDEEVLNRDVEDLIAFETKYAEMMASVEQRRNISLLYNLVNITELNDLMPFVSARFPGGKFRLTGIGISAPSCPKTSTDTWTRVRWSLWKIQPSSRT